MNAINTINEKTEAIRLAAINSMGQHEFVAALGEVFEHSPWVASAAWNERPFASIDALHEAMVDVVRRSPRETRVAFLCAHPELAGKEAEAGTMTADSVGEQKSAGLDALSAGEVRDLRELNSRYRLRHGFPFVIAARRYGKDAIFERLRERIERSSDAELDEALTQIAAITRLRIDNRVTA